MKMIIVMLLIIAANAQAAESPWRGSISIESAHHYQGLAQNQGNTSASGNLAWHATDKVSVGAWLGKYSLPFYYGASREVDYFISWGTELSFNKQIETALWRYTYTDPDYKKYEWSQWLTSLHLDERFTLTLGIADRLFLSNRTSAFAEFTARHNSGHLTTALSIGWNEMSGAPLHGFHYAQVKAAYNLGNWQLFADYSQAFGIHDLVTSQLVHQGASAGLTYVF